MAAGDVYHIHVRHREAQRVRVVRHGGCPAVRAPRPRPQQPAGVRRALATPHCSPSSGSAPCTEALHPPDACLAASLNRATSMHQVCEVSLSPGYFMFIKGHTLALIHACAWVQPWGGLRCPGGRWACIAMQLGQLGKHFFPHFPECRTLKCSPRAPSRGCATCKAERRLGRTAVLLSLQTYRAG